MQKIYNFFARRSIYWSTPVLDDPSILVLNKTGSEHVVKYFSNNESYFIFDDEKNIYLKSLFFSVLKDIPFIFNLRGLIVNYYINVIRRISPKIIITLVDNEPLYWDIDRVISQEIKFITIQNGVRFYRGAGDLDYESWHTKCIPSYSTFLGFSQFDFDYLVENKGAVKDFFPVGNMLISEYIQNYEKRNKIFDVCFIANSNNDMKHHKIIWKFLIKYYKRTNISICIALKRDHNTPNLHEHIKEISEYALALNAIVSCRILNSSQYLSDVSKVTLGSVGTTLLRQTFSRGNKIYPLNFVHKNFSPPFDILDQHLFPSYDDFDLHLTKLLTMDPSKYISNNMNYMSYVDTFDMNNPPHKKLLHIVNKILCS